MLEGGHFDRETANSSDHEEGRLFGNRGLRLIGDIPDRRIPEGQIRRDPQSQDRAANPDPRVLGTQFSGGGRLMKYLPQDLENIMKQILTSLNNTHFGEVGMVLVVHNGEVKRIKWIQERQELWNEPK